MVTIKEALDFGMKVEELVDRADKVLIKSNLTLDKTYGHINWFTAMEEAIGGRVVIIEKVIPPVFEGDARGYLTDAGYYITLEMIEGFVTRGFQTVSTPHVKGETQLPTKADNGSVGHDFYSKEAVAIPAGCAYKFVTDVKAFMLPHDYMAIHVRSSIGIKQNLMLANGTGIIDASYYNNSDNEGNIQIVLFNYGHKTAYIHSGERIAQGIFMDSQPACIHGGVLSDKRVGGTGSSGK